MRNFIYFESTEGGMEVINNIQCANDLSSLVGWMDDECKTEDKKLVDWMNVALVGQVYEHRLGYLVRLMDL